MKLSAGDSVYRETLVIPGLVHLLAQDIQEGGLGKAEDGNRRVFGLHGLKRRENSL